MPAPKDPKKREVWVRKLRIATMKYYEDPKNREKQSVAKKKYYEDPKNRAELCISQKIASNRPEVRAKNSISKKKFHQEHPGFRKEISNRPEVKGKVGKATADRWKDPEYREKHSQTMKKKWEDPKFKVKMLKVILKGLGLKPNKPEKLLNELLQRMFPNEYKYVGDGEFIIAGVP